MRILKIYSLNARGAHALPKISSAFLNLSALSARAGAQLVPYCLLESRQFFWKILIFSEAKTLILHQFSKNLFDYLIANIARKAKKYTCQIICAEKSLFRSGGGANRYRNSLTLTPPLLEVWSAHVEGKVEMKYIPTFGRGSENVIRFNFWPLFVTKKCILWFFSFYA